MPCTRISLITLLGVALVVGAGCGKSDAPAWGDSGAIDRGIAFGDGPSATPDVGRSPDAATTPADSARPRPDAKAPRPDVRGPKVDSAPPRRDLGIVKGCRSNANCTAAQFCSFGTDCGARVPGACKTRPRGCPKILKPVCGCNKKTYSNECLANSAGVSKAKDGACGVVTGCKSNADCKTRGTFCKMATGSCGKIAGKCTATPLGCTKIYKPVCGCDKKTYGNECLAWATRQSVQTTGVCKTTSRSCADVTKDWAKAIPPARQCTALLPVVQCNKLVKLQVECACLTAVNASNVKAVAQLTSLEAEFAKLGCGKLTWPCPRCKKVTGGKCVLAGGGRSGTCQSTP